MNETEKPITEPKEKFKSPISVIVGSLLYILVFLSPSFNNHDGLLSIMTSSEERLKTKKERPNYCEIRPEYQKECLTNPSLKTKSGTNNGGLFLPLVIYLGFLVVSILQAIENSKYYKKENNPLLNSAVVINSAIFFVFGWNWNSFLMGSNEGYSFYEFIKYYILPLI